jgi:hypothetical protein
MQVELRRSLGAPLHYWRTIFLVLFVGVLVAAIFRDAIAVLLSTLASAFVFSAYERRRWIVVPAETRAQEIFLRVGFAVAAAYILCNHASPALRVIAQR